MDPEGASSSDAVLFDANDMEIADMFAGWAVVHECKFKLEEK